MLRQRIIHGRIIVFPVGQAVMKNKILVLDDDPDILEIISYILTDKGYEVVSLSSGEEIFQTIRQFSPDLVLMDVMLGEMDGRIICNHLKNGKDTAALPVILISASHNLAASLRQEGAPNDFIAKPFDIDRLLQKVEGFLVA
ncbi:two-component system, OmpR family, phosphate regulon response regulator PhoB [Mucilaginibacter pineti]|uniref:Two-component system, OmpR family, phosphate regulon response regulator PhoB n=2 Tax=Mucilaginibacter pineti TaxID=1391627 RepID=A0A1G7NV61_9SPHI|nr:two-component system, OmpR family, phosphate regulon response regulator PhoB [Mucilaginibacter pineti]